MIQDAKRYYENFAMKTEIQRIIDHQYITNKTNSNNNNSRLAPSSSNSGIKGREFKTATRPYSNNKRTDGRTNTQDVTTTERMLRTTTSTTVVLYGW